MVLRNSFPHLADGIVGASDVGYDLAGLISRRSDGTPRAGILPRHFDPLVAARASMGVTVSAFEAVLTRSGQVRLIMNDGTVVVPIGNPPGANSRYDVVYVKQNENAAPFSDANNTPIFGYVSGGASATPSEAAALALVPAGGIPLATVLVPSTATTTQSSGVVINQRFPYTALAGRPIPFRNDTERSAWCTAPIAGTEALVNGIRTSYDGTAWRNVMTSGSPADTASWTVANNTAIGQNADTTFAQSALTRSGALAAADISLSGTDIILGPGMWLVDFMEWGYDAGLGRFTVLTSVRSITQNRVLDQTRESTQSGYGGGGTGAASLQATVFVDVGATETLRPQRLFYADATGTLNSFGVTGRARRVMRF